MQELIRNAIDLAIIATGSASVPLLYDIVRTAPQSLRKKQTSNGRMKASAVIYY
jgi:hypothetical protein